MNRKQSEEEIARNETGEYAVRRSRKSNLIVLGICLLLAVIVWLATMNAKDTAYLPLFVRGTGDCGYEVSLASVEVEGTVLAIKKAQGVTVNVENLPEGTYEISASDLEYPAGTAPTSDFEITVKVIK